MTYNPNQPRDPGGQDGGRWVKAGGGTDDVVAKAIDNAETIKPAPVYYHGTGTGGVPLKIGKPEWDGRFFITPDKEVAQRYADRHVDGEVKEIHLKSTSKILRPAIQPIDYTPDRLVAIVNHAESKGFDAVHFGGGIGTVVLNTDSLSGSKQEFSGGRIYKQPGR